LKEWGFDLVIAKDGAEAWNLLQQPETPTLVMLDWVLPQIDGIELCRRSAVRDLNLSDCKSERSSNAGTAPGYNEVLRILI
jgi:DNA-binding response OmpR family regulator